MLNGKYSYPPLKEKKPLSTSDAQEFRKRFKNAHEWTPAAMGDARARSKAPQFPWAKLRCVGGSLEWWLNEALEKKLATSAPWDKEDAISTVAYLNQVLPTYNAGPPPTYRPDVHGELTVARLDTWMNGHGWPKSRFKLAGKGEGEGEGGVAPAAADAPTVQPTATQPVAAQPAAAGAQAPQMVREADVPEAVAQEEAQEEAAEAE